MKPIESIIEELFGLYEKFGKADYIGEPVSQIEHMSQSAELAMRELSDDEVVLAAFFHDLGHICVMENHENNMGGFGLKNHEKIGADYLRGLGFPEKIARLVEYHVQAKRFLTFKFPAYFDILSEASKQTLVHQGGKMTEDEAHLFEMDELFHISIRMRNWDELAKEINTPLIDLTIIKQKARKILENTSANQDVTSSLR